MRVAHGVFGAEVRNGVADLSIVRFSPVALQLASVLALFDVLRRKVGVDRLARDPQLQPQQIALRIQARFKFALSDGPEKSCAMSSSRLQTSLTGTPGICLASKVAWRTKSC